MFYESLDEIAKRYQEVEIENCKLEIAKKLILKGVDLKIVVDVTKIDKDIIIDEIQDEVIKLRVAKRLLAKGWTRKELSETLGITKKQLKKYEKINQIYKNLRNYIL